MSQSKSILLVCPACKSRRQVPRELIGQRVQCRQCTAELTVEPPADDEEDFLLADEPAPPPTDIAAPIEAAATVATPAYEKSHDAAISEDDIPLAPLPPPPISATPAAKSPIEKPTKPSVSPHKPIYPVEDEAEPAAIPPIKTDTKGRKAPIDDESEPHESWVKPPDKITLTWLFTSGIYLYFLRPVAVSQWIVLSSFLFMSSLLFMLAVRFLDAGWMAVAGGCFALAGFAFAFVAYCYGSACFVAIIENTAYHLDKADRWPDSDFVEWIFHFLRLLYLLVIASLFVALVVMAAAAVHSSLVVPAALVGYHVFFPILLLSVLETNSFFWPMSPPILRSLIDDRRAWLAFYGASAALAVACFLSLLFVSKQQSVLSVLFSSLLTAAALFSYARLTGRLAAYIMHLDEREKSPPDE